MSSSIVTDTVEQTDAEIEQEARDAIRQRESEDGQAPAGNVDSVREAIFQQGILMDLDFGQWTGFVVMKPEYMGLEEFPPNVRAPRLQVFPKELVGKPPSVHNVTRRSVEAMTYSFPLSRGRYVPFTRFEALEMLLKKQKAKHITAVEDILDDFEAKRTRYIGEAVQNMIGFGEKYGLRIDSVKLRESLELRVPTADKVRKRYRFDWTPYRIEAPRNVKIAAFNEEARRRLDRSMRGWVEETMLVLRGRISDIAEKIREVLAAKGQGSAEGLPEKSKNAILKQIEVVQTLNCFGDTEAGVMIQRLQESVSNSFATDDGLTNLINDVSQFSGADIDASLHDVMQGMIGDAPREVEV